MHFYAQLVRNIGIAVFADLTALPGMAVFVGIAVFAGIAMFLRHRRLNVLTSTNLLYTTYLESYLFGYAQVKS